MKTQHALKHAHTDTDCYLVSDKCWILRDYPGCEQRARGREGAWFRAGSWISLCSGSVCASHWQQPSQTCLCADVRELWKHVFFCFFPLTESLVVNTERSLCLNTVMKMLLQQEEEITDRFQHHFFTFDLLSNPTLDLLCASAYMFEKKKKEINKMQS